MVVEDNEGVTFCHEERVVLIEGADVKSWLPVCSNLIGFTVKANKVKFDYGIVFLSIALGLGSCGR